MELIIQVILLVVGFIMMIKGADWFVEGASKLADRMGIPQIVIGLTIVAAGTSAPEAAISIAAAMKGSAEIAVGNVLGSNILNVLLILGITSVIVPLAVKKNTVRYEIPFTILITVLLMGLGFFDGSVGRLDGAALWLFMILYLAYLLRMAKKGEPVAELEEVEKAGEHDNVPKMLLFLLIGCGLIVLGSQVTVEAAKEIARIFGMSERLIALTIVAFGTSLPELVTSVTAAFKKNADIAIGNIVGSNIFNILFVIGTAALITPVPYAPGFLADSIVCIAAAVLLLACVLNKKRRLEKWGGVIMLAGYAGYFIYLIGQPG